MSALESSTMEGDHDEDQDQVSPQTADYVDSSAARRAKLEADAARESNALNSETFGDMNDDGDFNVGCASESDNASDDESAGSDGGSVSPSALNGQRGEPDDAEALSTDRERDDCDSPLAGSTAKRASSGKPRMSNGNGNAGKKSGPSLALDCALCNMRFSAPKLLHCLHVFDAHCLLARGALHERTVTCPLCKLDTPLGGEGVASLEQLDAALPTDHTRIALVELDAVRREELRCTSCKTQERACARCTDCPGFLCGTCLAAHQQMRMFEGHSVWRFEELFADADSRRFHRPICCAAHRMAKCDVYCNTCESAVCKECRLTQHVSHKCEPLTAQLVVELNAALQARSAAVKQATNACSELKDKLQNDLEELALQRDSVRGSIEETYQSYRAILERARTAALRRLDTICNDAEFSLMGAIEEENRLAERIETTAANADRLIANSSDQELTAVFSFVRSRLDGLVESVGRNATRERLAKPLGKVTFRTSAPDFERAVDSYFGRVLNQLALFNDSDSLAVDSPCPNFAPAARAELNVNDLVSNVVGVDPVDKTSLDNVDSATNLLNSLMLDQALLDRLAQPSSTQPAGNVPKAPTPNLLGDLGLHTLGLPVTGQPNVSVSDFAATLAALGNTGQVSSASMPQTAADLLAALNSGSVTQTTSSLTQVTSMPGGAAGTSALGLALGAAAVNGPASAVPVHAIGLPNSNPSQTSPVGAGNSQLAVHTAVSQALNVPGGAASPSGGAQSHAVVTNLLNMLQAAQQVPITSQAATASISPTSVLSNAPNGGANPNSLLAASLPGGLPLNAALANLLTPGALGGINPLANLAALGGSGLPAAAGARPASAFGVGAGAASFAGVNQASASLLAAAISGSNAAGAATAGPAGGPAFPTKQANPVEIRSKFGTLGQGKSQFNSPHGFCLGFDEEIVVADTNNHRVQVFDKSGDYKCAFGVAGRDEGQLWYPRKVACIRQTGKYVVCDRGNERSRMQLFTKTGHFVRKIAIRYIDIVAGLAINQEGHIVAVDSVSPTVFIIAETGDLVKWFDCSDYMREPSDIAVSGKEYFVCDFKGHCVCVFNEEGAFVRRIGGENVTNYPNGIDISDAGDVLVGDSHGNRFHVVVFARDGTLLGEFECPYIKVSRCCGLKITSEGYIVTLAKNNHHVLVLNTLFIT